MMPIRISIEATLAAIVGLLLLALLAAGASLPMPLFIVRLLLVVAFVLFAPGYALLAAILPAPGLLDRIEHIALSIGLSVAVVPPLALLLDKLPWGIQPASIASALVLFLYTCGAIAMFRRRSFVDSEPSAAWFDTVRAATNTRRWVAAALITLAGIALCGWLLAGLTARRDQSSTEFYIVGTQGEHTPYPQTIAAGATLSITLGIVSHEQSPQAYRVEVWASEAMGSEPRKIATQDDSAVLVPGAVRELPVSWQMSIAGRGQEVNLLLFRPGDREPYRRLTLRLDVSPS